MSEDPHKTITVKLKNKQPHRFNVYWDEKVFPKKGDERVVDNVIEIIKGEPEKYMKIMQENSTERVESTYRPGAYFTVKKHGASPALFITK